MFKTFLIIFVVFLILRRFGSFMFKSWVSKVTAQQGYGSSANANQRREGEIFISKNKKKDDGKTGGVGEYVDYEEVE